MDEIQGRIKELVSRIKDLRRIIPKFKWELPFATYNYAKHRLIQSSNVPER